jgi:hypothetical protein
MALYDDLAGDRILIITGATLRAEEMDRPLAYGLAEVIRARLNETATRQPLVMSDIGYLNCDTLHKTPAVSIGGPGVNAVAQYWLKRLPNVLEVDDVLLIQMDLSIDDLRCSIWGYDHDTTVEALEIFTEKGYLDRFLEGVGEWNPP